MRFVKFLNEDVIKTALNYDEPATGKKYSDKYVKKRIETIEKAIDSAENKKFDNEESQEAIMADLEDKLDKWSNVDKETAVPKPAGPPPEETEKEQEEEEDEAEKEIKDQEKEADKELDKEAKAAKKETDLEDKENRQKDKEDREEAKARRREKAEKNRKAMQMAAAEKKKKTQKESRLIRSKIELR